MKLEKLNKGRFKNFVIIILTISLLRVTFMNRSKAKYRVTQSIQIVDGEVNYKVPDLNVIALYKQIEKGNTNDENYDSITDVPIGDYIINTDKSYCTIVGNDAKLKNKMIYENGEISINIKKKGTKCYVYLDMNTGISETELLAKYKENTIDTGCPAYEDVPSITSIENKNSLLCKGIDDLGDTYYFRGNVTNNWVKIGDFYWRIVRFNGNSSIRLIYSGTGSPITSGTGTQITTTYQFDPTGQPYNNSFSSAENVKYMYGSTSSSIKNELDTWFGKNLTSYVTKLDGKAGFCNDADKMTTSDNIYFKPYDRFTNKKATLKCNTPTTNLFTTKGNTNGNEKLEEIPIGLITIDEVFLAGGLPGSSNSEYYLYTGQYYWTMSPWLFGLTYNTARVYIVYEDGQPSGARVDSVFGARPVINLKADTIFKTTSEINKGTSTNPYIVVI